jgi:predicted Zn-dependent protease
MLRRTLSFVTLALLMGACAVVEPLLPPEAQEAVQRNRKCSALADVQIAVEEENAIGSVVAMNWIKNGGGLAVDPPSRRGARPPATKGNEATRYLNVVGGNLGAQSDRPTLGWTFGILEAPEVNAFSAPGGYVFVTRGLVNKVDNMAQLAGVLSHEIAHVSNRDALQVYGEVKANQCRTALAAEIAGDAAATQVSGFDSAIQSGTGGYLDLNDVTSALQLQKMGDKLVDSITAKGYAKNDEFEADQVAAGLLISAGYDPNEYVKFLGKLEAGGSFANHPDPADRQARLETWLAGQKSSPSTFGNADYPFTSYAKPPMPKVLAAIR